MSVTEQSERNASKFSVNGLTVSYGAHRALDAVSLAAPGGSITGLIGPNGAGKTTLFNSCSGLLRPEDGTVSLFDRDITRLAPAARARLGLGRTFQRIEVVNSMTAAANVALGAECRSAGRHPFRQFVASRRDREAVAQTTESALHDCGLEALADLPMVGLSTGQRRLVELARVVAAGFTFLLLDEPSSGLDDSETEQFAKILTTLSADRGIGILLVEHDMKLVMEVCSYIYVLDFGHLIFEGTPADVCSSELVQRAYLGEEF